MNKIAQTPPMGWNSWDCYGSAVTEKEVRSNAEYMAKHMAKHGWEYVVVDILWFDPDAEDSQYTPYGDICIDEYGRVIPAENRFPSAAGGKGFGPLADYVHSLGLKFGIHILRGVPRKAVYARCPVKGTDLTCRDIAHRNDNCPWNTDMYGVDCMRRGAQEYYDSIFELYAAWGVDYVKVDDIASPYHSGEIELVHNAIEHCGRDIVLSLSCGPAPRDKAEHLCRFANLWRTTGDFWDDWNDLYHAFEICHEWEGIGGPGHWPDADMLPFGHLAIRATERGWGDRWTHFTQDEQITLMTLWCIFRSPLTEGRGRGRRSLLRGLQLRPQGAGPRGAAAEHPGPARGQVRGPRPLGARGGARRRARAGGRRAQPWRAPHQAHPRGIEKGGKPDAMPILRQGDGARLFAERPHGVLHDKAAAVPVLAG